MSKNFVPRLGRLLDQVREVMRFHHYSLLLFMIATESVVTMESTMATKSVVTVVSTVATISVVMIIITWRSLAGVIVSYVMAVNRDGCEN